MGRKGEKKNSTNEYPQPSLLPSRTELRGYAKYENMTDEQLDEIGAQYVKLAFALIDVVKDQASSVKALNKQLKN